MLWEREASREGERFYYTIKHMKVGDPLTRCVALFECGGLVSRFGLVRGLRMSVFVFIKFVGFIIMTSSERQLGEHLLRFDSTIYTRVTKVFRAVGKAALLIVFS